MLPVVGALIPLIVIYKQVGLYDSRLGMILLYAASNLPLVIWLMRSFLSEVPKELTQYTDHELWERLRPHLSQVAEAR